MRALTSWPPGLTSDSGSVRPVRRSVSVVSTQSVSQAGRQVVFTIGAWHLTWRTAGTHAPATGCCVTTWWRCHRCGDGPSGEWPSISTQSPASAQLLEASCSLSAACNFQSCNIHFDSFVVVRQSGRQFSASQEDNQHALKFSIGAALAELVKHLCSFTGSNDETIAPTVGQSLRFGRLVAARSLAISFRL